MAKPGDDWRTFFRWEKRQILEGRGARDGPSLTQGLRAQWSLLKKKKSEKDEYVKNIRSVVDSENRVRTLDRNLERSTQRRVGRKSLHKSRMTKLYLLEGLRARLVSFQKRQRTLDGSGKIITSAASRRNVARMVEGVDAEMRNTKLESTLATAAEYFDDYEEAPKALQNYIIRSCEEMTWKAKSNPFCTEKEMAARLQAEVREAQFYQDVERVGWAKKQLASYSVRRSREEGDVECWGHPFDADRGEDMDGTRDQLVRDWEKFVARYWIAFDSRAAPLPPLWAISSAKARAEMIFDHDGTFISPPELDTNAVSEALLAAVLLDKLDSLTTAENNFYITNTVHHESLDISVDRYLRKGGYQTEFFEDISPCRPPAIPRLAVTLRQGETIEMFSAGRRALRHIWESRIRVMMFQQRSAGSVTNEMWHYERALALFDSNQGNQERPWIADRGDELLKERKVGAKKTDSAKAELATKQPALPGTIESTNLRGNWIMKGAVGDGTSGVVFLWVRYSPDGTIRGRMATKDSQFTAAQWNKSKYWLPDEHGRPGRVAKEAFIQSLFSDLPRHESKIVELWDARVYRTQRMIRLYMEYCSFGTLVGLLETYSTDVTMSDYNARGVLPEYVVWALFESLVIAAYAMEKGHLPGSQDPDSEWVVVHQDLRPPNVFLTDNVSETWPSCPTFKVGDFGSAERTNNSDPRNPQDLRRPGTPDGAPPEQYTEGTHDDGGIRLSSKSNIWSCGRNVLASMGAGTLDAEDLAFVADESPYSDILQMLALACVANDPEDRPGPEELLEEIRRHVEKVPLPPDLLGRIDVGLRNLVRWLMGAPIPPTSMKFRARKEEEKLIIKDDEYKLGFVDVTMVGA
ncbi:unnamed protein product [Zymoseptoria tritici ST99CH_1A5]|uniref:non-specific serine/threonine protein kinase n=1 Tax=Zymoseptoria tritici ST99CH_1A5 TaxID=1276529 RepID=A0A1Y6L6H2_ZYMTR|nr:unnamed protein product [Zymoseptoria tritici ST99CH_1A5]